MNRLSKSTASEPIRILITTGDPDGIGWEVTHKALAKIGPMANVQFIHYRHPSSIGPREKRNLGAFKRLSVESLSQALKLPFHKNELVEIVDRENPAHWVEEAASACLAAKAQALVTAPLSKVAIHSAGLKDIGHTEILARISGKRNLFMGFIGEKFAVVLALGHLSLRESVVRFTPTVLAHAVDQAHHMRRLLPAHRRRLPLAIVGINPHASENGLIGKEEAWMHDYLQQITPCGLDVRGPLPPDSAFLPSQWENYSIYVVPYHDQGLIPFKMVHGFNGGVHVTLGLPFIRTSVDHGTAKDIFGKNRAQFGSMRDAILSAIRWSKEKQK